jgi:hypothetical protein
MTSSPGAAGDDRRLALMLWLVSPREIEARLKEQGRISICAS